MDEIVVNGTSYRTPDEMTPEHRRIFLHAVRLLSTRDVDDLPDRMEVYGNPDGSDLRIETSSSREEVSFDAHPMAGGLDALPPAMRAAAREALEAEGAAFGDDPGGPMSGTTSPEPLDGAEIERRLRRSSDTGASFVPGRKVRILIYTLGALVLGLLLLARIL